MLFFKWCQILGVDPVTWDDSTQACWVHATPHGFTETVLEQLLMAVG